MTAGTTPERRPVADWSGPYRSYDLLKEIVVALVVMTILAVTLAVVFGAPQRRAVTFREWATQDPVGFLSTTLDELTGQSGVATYGPPYTAGSDAAQTLLGFSPQRIAGVRIPIDTTNDFVLHPLGSLAGTGSGLSAALSLTFSSTSSDSGSSVAVPPAKIS